MKEDMQVLTWTEKAKNKMEKEEESVLRRYKKTYTKEETVRHGNTISTDSHTAYNHSTDH